MTRQVVSRPSSTIRRQQFLPNQSSSSLRLTGNQSPGGSMHLGNQSPEGSIRIVGSRSPGGSKRFAEVAGGTTAECAAVFCCCPCGIMNFLVLAVYKVPAGLCKKALKNKKIKRLKKKGMLTQRRKCKCGCDDTEIQIHPVCVNEEELVIEGEKSESLTSKEMKEMENEMWDKFYRTGFWRSPSQRDTE